MKTRADVIPSGFVSMRLPPCCAPTPLNLISPLSSLSLPLPASPDFSTCPVFPLLSAPPGFVLRPKDELIIEVSCRDAYLRLCCVAVARDGHEIRLDKPPESQHPGSFVSNPNPEAELCSALACLQTDQNLARDFCMLECAEMALVNNQHYHQSFSSALSKLITSLQSRDQRSKITSATGELTDFTNGTDSTDLLYVLDVSEGFSLLSLIAASQGHVKAYSSVEKSKQQELLKRLARSNGIPEQSLEFWLNHMEDEQAMLQRPSREKLWTAIILDCVETCGLIRQKVMEKASLAR